MDREILIGFKSLEDIPNQYKTRFEIRTNKRTIEPIWYYDIRCNCENGLLYRHYEDNVIDYCAELGIDTLQYKMCRACEVDNV